MSRAPRECPQCKAMMQQRIYPMTSLERCDACALLFLDHVELDFLTGHSIEQALFEDTLLDEPQLRCAGCQDPLHLSTVVLQVPVQPQRQERDPYRDNAPVRGPRLYQDVSYDLHVCVQCRGVLLQEDLFTQLVALFS